MSATSIVGYTFRAEVFCPEHLIALMLDARELSPAARDMEPEDVLEQHAAATAVDREDESTFDSEEFPKVIFGSSAEGSTCGICGVEL